MLNLDHDELPGVIHIFPHTYPQERDHCQSAFEPIFGGLSTKNDDPTTFFINFLNLFSFSDGATPDYYNVPGAKWGRFYGKMGQILRQMGQILRQNVTLNGANFTAKSMYLTIRTIQSRLHIIAYGGDDMKSLNGDNKRKKKIRQKDIFMKESNELARAQLTPATESVWDERIIAEVASHIRKSDLEFRDIEISLAELVGVNNYHEISGIVLRCIYNSVRRLIGSNYIIHNGHGNYKAYAVFSYIEKKGGLLIAKFNPDMAEHLLQLKREFALRSLPEFQCLSSVHSQQLYRLLNSWRHVSSVDVPIKELHAITNASRSQVGNFKEFRTRILEIAEREINLKTEMRFRWEAIKAGRRVAVVRFIFLGAEGEDVTAEKFDDEYIDKYQVMANACFERCFELGKRACRPNKGRKCTYCRTRGRMYAREIASMLR